MEHARLKDRVEHVCHANQPNRRVLGVRIDGKSMTQLQQLSRARVT